MQLASLGFKEVTAMIACENYPALKDRQLSKISKEFPPWLGKLHGDHKEHGRCYILSPRYGGGIICFRNLDDTSKYQSAEFALIAVDELTKNLYETFTFLWTRLRWPGLPAIQCQFMAATNPGGIGHGWVKQLWMDRKFPIEWLEPIDYSGTFAYVPSTAKDNPHLDPGYWNMLSTLPPHLREAFKNGDWNVFVGQAFHVDRETHAIAPIWPIPEFAPLYMTFDWGFGKPFSLGWWWVDSDGRLIRFAEWYGWNGTPDEGLRLPDSLIAEGIVERERKMNIWGRNIIRLAGPDCFQKRPDYKGGGQGPSTAEVFASQGVILSPGDPSRAIKIRAFRERLKPLEDDFPMMVAYADCDQFFRTLSILVVDKNNPEDIDTKGEDHCLHGDTLVCTDRGDIPIRNLVGTTGKVLSVNGYTKYHSCRLTQRNASVVKVTFKDGRSIVCTDDHRFLVAGGFWVEAKHLLDENCHISMAAPTTRRHPSCESSSSMTPHKNSTEHATTFAGSIFSEKGRGFTARFGSIITAKFPRARTFITSFMTDLTTRSKTSLFGRRSNTVLTMPNSTTKRTGPKQCTKGQPHGMVVRKVLNGTASITKSTPAPHCRGQEIVKDLLKDSVSSAANLLLLHIGQPASALGNATKSGAEIMDFMMSKESALFVASPLQPTSTRWRKPVVQLVQEKCKRQQSVRVTRIEQMGTDDVYCLDVEDASHAFAVCGGILVHNCYDECCHIAMARPMTPAPKEPVKSMAEQDFERILSAGEALDVETY
jgi:hypothetical protein